MAKVCISVSGGVDSSVAAYLLKQQGHDVFGMFMINWHDTEGLVSGDCPLHDDEIFAKLVCKKLDIPLHIVDLSETYYKRVTEYMFKEYEAGRTPNPDVLCNREIKFDAFLEEALKLGADYVATGHYCQKRSYTDENGNEIFQLVAGADNNKDQSYFLCQLNQYQLSKVLFPIGHLEKPEVRRIAEEQGLATAKRKDSQGICFVGKVNLPDFLKQKLKTKEGKIIEIPFYWPGYAARNLSSNPLDYAKPYNYTKNDGSVVGKHNGAHFFTIGQSKYLGISGRKEKMFVIGTDVVNNIVYVGEGHDHPGLNRNRLLIKKDDVHLISVDKIPCICKVRIRYRQPLQDAYVTTMENGDVFVRFIDYQRGITPGQFAAFYVNDVLVASGVIN